MRFGTFVVLTALLLPRPAAAQDTPRFGIVMGYPAQIGAIWTIADRVAIRPELNWTRSTFDSVGTSTVFNPTGTTTTVFTNTSESNAIGTGVTALIYMSTHDALRTYAAPRVAYSRTTSSNDVGGAPLNIVVSPVDTTSSTFAVSGSVGAQYAVARRFAIFGELGLQVGRSTMSPPSSPLARGDTKLTTTGFRSGAGVILFFGS
jgi:Outer membrane protein beta-barrel domain